MSTLSPQKSKKEEGSAIEQLLGKTLLKDAQGGSVPTATALQDKDLVLLYFSASWCPPCRKFSPILKEFYQNNASQGKLQVVYVSSDKSLSDFNDYYGSMMPSWLAIPTDQQAAVTKNQLAAALNITGIPTLVVLDAKTGLFVSNTARQAVMSVDKDKNKQKALIQDWKSTQACSIEEGLQKSATAAAASGNNNNMLMMFLRNPLFIFGMIYAIKWIIQKVNEYAAAGGGEEAAPPAAIQDEQQEEEPEF